MKISSTFITPMESLNLTIRLLAASQVILFMLLIGFSQVPMRIRLVGLALMTGILSYLMMPWVATLGYSAWLENLWLPAAIVPSLLLIFVWFAFETCNTTPKWLFLVTGISILSSTWLRIQHVGLPESPLWLQSLKIVILFVAMAVVLHGRDSDLVERRQKLRYVFVFCFTAMTLVICTVEFANEFAVPLKLNLVGSSMILAFSMSLNFFYLKIKPSIQLTPEPVITEPVKGDPIIDQLLSRMTSERLYADHDLRVGTLADLLNVPEYQLRKKINQQLGYQNFNQFVNHYRIKEAGEKLLADKRVPVLSVALDVGFRSISSFNTAFQRQYGVAATLYRTQH